MHPYMMSQYVQQATNHSKGKPEHQRTNSSSPNHTQHSALSTPYSALSIQHSAISTQYTKKPACNLLIPFLVYHLWYEYLVTSNSFSLQHSALNTQHSTLRTHHSALRTQHSGPSTQYLGLSFNYPQYSLTVNLWLKFLN